MTASIDPLASPVRKMRITKVAALAGTTVRALRYYETVGLLAPTQSMGQTRFGFGLRPPQHSEWRKSTRPRGSSAMG